ncbi:FmdB family zinc ribbon protein [Aciditerrimonas ferrireducens]|jgi:putative FmdB family regulatory protein|uniref:FmdB family zinc ribbon protein n=1 Tax=Aciditerrimonas ferrireducens TaxID=667306 RepID=A0ABV6C251_9ACTN|nr:FmdB family zinc ribbon protein [Aciditerrimonas ferrireducens]MCK4176551.1 FmdB family transcriptional regulator [Aciditerrimonas ferrireducens]
MPTYEYVCTACGQHLEVVQSFADEPLRTCPACAGSLKKVFSPIGIVFKGSGFYKTDSRGGSASAAPAKSSADGAGASTSSSGESGSSTATGSTSGSAASAS